VSAAELVTLVLLVLLAGGVLLLLLRVVRLEHVSAVLPHVQRDTQTLSERVHSMESGQAYSNQSLRSAATAILGDLRQTHSEVAAIQAHLHARQELDARNAQVLHALELVIAGSKSKGSAGEALLEVPFSQLPAEWQVRNYHVQGGVVEFGLRLPNNLVLPIDSKLPATAELQRFHAAESREAQARIKAEIEREVLKRVAEVRKYLDPDLTLGYGLAVVPDGVYELCGPAVTRAATLNVLVINYAMFLPYILLVYKVALAASSDIDRLRLDGYMRQSQELLGRLESKLTGAFDGSLKQLTNSRDEMLSAVSQLSAGIARLRQFSIEPPVADEQALAELETFDDEEIHDDE